MEMKSDEFQATLEYAKFIDDVDILFSFKNRFHFPQKKGKNAIYFCGNSLGLQPISTSYLMEKELEDWAKLGVDGHFEAQNPWFSYANQFPKSLAKIIGAKEDEVAVMNTLTVNLHLLMISFYRPTKERFK